MKESLKKKQELAQRRLQLEMESEQIAIEEQLAVVEAETRVLDHLESISAVGSLRDTLHHTQRWHQEIDCEESRQHVPVSKARCNHESVRVAEQKLSFQQPVDIGGPVDKDSQEVIMSVVKHLRKPQSELFCFDGNPLSYRRFIRQFKTMRGLIIWSNSLRVRLTGWLKDMAILTQQLSTRQL